MKKKTFDLLTLRHIIFSFRHRAERFIFYKRKKNEFANENLNVVDIRSMKSAASSWW